VFLAVVVLLTTLWWYLHRAGSEGAIRGPGVRAGELPLSGPDAGRLRLATWNIRQFPDHLDGRPRLAASPRTNLEDLRTALAGLNADLWGFAEIKRPGVLGRVLGGNVDMVVGREAGGGDLHAVLAWRTDRFEVIDHDLRPRAMGKPLERSVGAYLRSRQSGLDLTVLQVHLRAHPRAYAYRLEQYEQIAAWVERAVEATGDDDVVVMGDLNTTGPEGGTTADELRVADQVLARADLRRLHNATGCTEYWEGPGPPDGRLIASTLDHVYVRDLTERAEDVPLQAWLHCLRAECQDLVSRPGAEDGTFWDLSDHCPLTFEVADLDHDPSGLEPSVTGSPAVEPSAPP
jgi:hypothetical protein